ncbi:histone H1 [Elizabethkingia sp. HX WYD]|nr:histone H1 [Elizabethkingia meningoseptica]MDX8575118.1 histone H1 [Elizabethkingia sp. HX WYD]
MFMQELLEKIGQEFDTFKTDSNLQLEKGNKAAGTRARKAALELSKLLKDFRKVSVEESKK